MAQPAEFTRNNDDDLQIRASFPNGRYSFSLQSGAVTLLKNLGYEPGDRIPWKLFQVFVAIEDAWLPNANVEDIDSLAEPSLIIPLSESEARNVANYLSGKKVGQQAVQQLESISDRSHLAQYIDTDELTNTAEWVEETRDLISDDSVDDRFPETDDSDNSSAENPQNNDPAEANPVARSNTNNPPDSPSQPSAAEANTEDLTESVLTTFQRQIEQNQQVSQATVTVLSSRVDNSSFGDDDDVLAAIIEGRDE